MTSFGSGDAREGFVVFGDRLVFAVKRRKAKNWLLLLGGEFSWEKKFRSVTIRGLWFSFCVKSKETNSAKR